MLWLNLIKEDIIFKNPRRDKKEDIKKEIIIEVPIEIMIGEIDQETKEDQEDPHKIEDKTIHIVKISFNTQKNN